MAKVHRSYRLDAELVEAVASWAEAHSLTATQATERLIQLGLTAAERKEGQAASGAPTAEEAEALRTQVAQLTANAEAWADQKKMLGEHIRDLRASISTLTAEIGTKNEQIEGLRSITEHAQVLQAAHVAGELQGAPDVPQDVPQSVPQGETQPRGIWAWLRRKIEGR